MVKQRNNATAPVKGIIYQFLVALQKCFELQADESVYIETFGDVSVFGEETEQIEIKFYKKDLTDMDINVWKTLSNWLDDKFDTTPFNSLILLTTQRIKSSSEWYGWNEKNLSQRLMIINKMKDDYGRKQRKNKELSIYIEKIFDDAKQEKLKIVLKKFFIDHSTPNDINLYSKIRDTYAKALPSIQKDKYIRSMLGFIISPSMIKNNSWNIEYQIFTKEAEELTKTLVETTTIFPEKVYLKDIKTDEYNEHLFVEKIRQIQYEKEIPNAVTNYAQTYQLIIEEISNSHVVSKSLNEYDEEIYKNYLRRYQKECRNLDDNCNLIKQSKNFYDDAMFADSDKTFYTYSNVPDYFKCGILHIKANDKDSNLKWLLEYGKDS